MRYAMIALAASALLSLAPASGRCEDPAKDQTRVMLRAGGVAYGPGSVTAWRCIRHYFEKNGFPIDFVLYSNYDALVEALKAGHVDVAWNTPLAHARYHVQAGGQSQTLVMRDVDRDFRAVVVVRKDASVASPSDLAGKTLVLGSKESAELTVLPVYYLKKHGVDFDKVKVLSLHAELDNWGCPCSSEQDVWKALQKGRGEAGVIGEATWKRLSAEKPAEAAAYQVVWTSPAFSHCVFTAPKDFDKKLGERFARLMLAMDGKDTLTAEILKQEACTKWVPGTHEGFEDLVKAVREGADRK